MGKLLVLASGVVKVPKGGVKAVSAYVALSAGAHSRIFRVRRARPRAPSVEELPSATTLDMKRFQGTLQEDLQPAVDELRREGHAAHVELSRPEWLAAIVRKHLKDTEGIDVGVSGEAGGGGGHIGDQGGRRRTVDSLVERYVDGQEDSTRTCWRERDGLPREPSTGTPSGALADSRGSATRPASGARRTPGGARADSRGSVADSRGSDAVHRRAPSRKSMAATLSRCCSPASTCTGR